MRISATICSGLLLWGCGVTTPPGPGDTPAGTVFYSRSGTASSPGTSAPLAFTFGATEQLIPLDLSAFTADPDQGRRVVGKNFTVANDGSELIATAFGHLLKFALPSGDLIADLGDFGTASNPRLSPDGLFVAFQIPTAGSETWVVRADGSEPVRVLEGVGAAGVSYGPPTWLGSERLLVPVQDLRDLTVNNRVLRFTRPGWTESEYESLDGVFGETGLRLAATRDGTRLFVGRCLGLLGCAILEYSPAGPSGAVILPLSDELRLNGAVSPDGQFIAIGGRDIYIYEVATRRLVRTIASEEQGDVNPGEDAIVWVAGPLR